ncbi:hypothetical protein GCM10009678_00920 [Actinomadura kijaniata]|uniref:Alkanesulfonate monooxygenase SsuD/methylene tetrahydromethanopterin reductase-like flavin-dependent oxidoreductase (Luciferase family) n=1 Tax=Actinomadura namibiensis TaxID=182080 RepID=A0A7W3QN89_ACTNM|nr:alkanesulfonate monooxygenase SsuD/methylene tetrahydromethanopterin reductase-like flavin-dependent oxidoreductase (luciferase family) [Actinomadura namibiensis]
MTRFGYFLACEEHGPRALVRQAQLAERAGFDALWISDHYHPWLEEQGESPLVRVHPAVVAQAAATCAVMTEGRFTLGVGSGEALNEHVTDPRWPTNGWRCWRRRSR